MKKAKVPWYPSRKGTEPLLQVQLAIKVSGEHVLFAVNAEPPQSRGQVLYYPDVSVPAIRSSARSGMLTSDSHHWFFSVAVWTPMSRVLNYTH